MLYKISLFPYNHEVVDTDIGKDYVGEVNKPTVTDVKGTTAVISWEVRWWLSNVVENCYNLLLYRTTPFLLTMVFLSSIKSIIVLWVDHINRAELFLSIRISTL